MDVKRIDGQPKVFTHQVFVVSKKSLQDGTVLLVKQKEACTCTDEKLKQYRKENRLLIVDLMNQKVVVQKGECAEFFKARNIDKIEFKAHPEGSQAPKAMGVTGFHEVSEEEFAVLMAVSLKEASDQLERGKEVLKKFTSECRCKDTPNLREIIRQYLKLHPEKSVSEIVTRMLEIWNSAAKDDREQAKISDEKKQRLTEDLMRRRLLDSVVKDEIKENEVNRSFNNKNLRVD
jgi:hypothetical protein